MSINVTKSCCIRIGPRFNNSCCAIVNASGLPLPWVKEMSYLGIHLLSSHIFKCSFDAIKRSFFRSVNAVFGKIGRTASEEIVLELVKRKCLPILMYGTEACGMSNTDKRPLDFAVTRFLMKLFRCSSKPIIDECMVYFKFKLPSELFEIRCRSFAPKLHECKNALLKLFVVN